MRRVVVGVALLGLMGCINEGPTDDGPGGQGDASGTVDMGVDADIVVVDAMVDAAEPDVIVINEGAEINVSPRVIDFGRVPAGQTADQIATVTNIGQVSLEITEITLSGAAAFQLLIGDVNLNAGLPADPDGDGTPGLSPGASFELRIVYAPEVEGPAAGAVQIRSSDTQQPEVEIRLTANGATPCLVINPPALDFGGALPMRNSRRSLLLERCGGAPVEIGRIALADGSAPVFAVEDAELPIILPAVQRGEPPPVREVMIAFTPPALEAYQGVLIVESTDPVSPRVEIPVAGAGSDNACPVAAIAEDVFEVRPGDIVQLDASPSTDPDGPGGLPVEYSWVVTQRPEGSAGGVVERFQDPRRPAETGLPDDLGTPRALFYAALAGVYTLELRVTDNLGLTAPSDACPQPPATVRIDVRYENDVTVEMVWNTPGDPDQSDAEGADVDLHLRHPLGDRWAAAPFDCYYNNVNPDWGPVGDAGNPRLEIDDPNGAGPELISLNAPEDTRMFEGVGYLVGVHYFRELRFENDMGWGPSEVTVRIYLEGLVASEFARVLQATDNFWEVAGIRWTPDDRRVVEVNRFIEDISE